jgi:hypothetical protein
MQLLDPTYIRDRCDYSFGDHPGVSLYGGYMKPANSENQEFMDTYRNLVGKKQYMTLFIDSIRLYNRPGIKYSAVELVNEFSRNYKDQVVKEYFSQNDLLKLCSELKDMKFVIFVFFDDTPIDDEIFEKIPENVISIYAANAISFGYKVKPMPYGIQRKLWTHDNRHTILSAFLDNNSLASKLLYMNHNVGHNPNRIEINNHFSDKSWATIKSPGGQSEPEYLQYLSDIKDHKFVICPDGNAIGCECHRDWEVLYMKRVPVVIKSEYLEKIFEDFPVLMVESFKEITEEFLEKNEHLYQQALNLDLSKLDIKILFEKIISEVEDSLKN